MDISIAQRLQQVEENFLVAAISDEATLKTFYDGWATLLSDIEAHASHLPPDALRSAHTVASRIAIIARAILDLRTKAVEMMSPLKDELEDMLTSLHLCNSPVPTSSSIPNLNTTPYIKPCYQWLLANLHNPYPTRAVKAAISRRFGCQVKDIDNWFIDVRRRIGWNALRRNFFANKRQSHVEAATRFFKMSDHSVGPQLEMEFAKIQSQAEELYSGAWPKPGDSSSPCVLPSQATDYMPTCSKTQRKKRSEARDPSSYRVASSLQAVPLARSADKRPPSLSNSDTRSQNVSTRSTQIPVNENTLSLPNSSSDNEPEVSTLRPSPVHTGIQDSQPHSSLKRKRRSSTGDSPRLPKRLQHISTKPRNHPVSDNAPVPEARDLESLEQWFSSGYLFDQSSNDLEISGPLEVKLFSSSHLIPNPETADDALQFSSRPTIHSQAQTSSSIDSHQIHCLYADNAHSLQLASPSVDYPHPSLMSEFDYRAASYDLGVSHGETATSQSQIQNFSIDWSSLLDELVGNDLLKDQSSNFLIPALDGTPYYVDFIPALC
ncbi:hypothetical protein AX17_000644 [Amanita inopinata Kibby_2008]|nr:hypothetical protein AX17_000644 [Amanita inopinata Kibby_2008]